jgi:hypothetical protein
MNRVFFDSLLRRRREGLITNKRRPSMYVLRTFLNF